MINNNNNTSKQTKNTRTSRQLIIKHAPRSLLTRKTASIAASFAIGNPKITTVSKTQIRILGKYFFFCQTKNGTHSLSIIEPQFSAAKVAIDFLNVLVAK
jgi:hypothetical protein